jgi:hypothetical protein
VYCTPGSLIGGRGWYPAELFDYNWDAFGCNRLKCGTCGPWVRVSAGADPDARHYACKCQEHDAYGYHLIGSDEAHLHPFVTAWACGGHPEFTLPATLDGVALSDARSIDAAVGTALKTPPFVAPKIKHPSFWVERLFHLLRSDSTRRSLADAVIAQFASTDPVTVRAALDFFCRVPAAPGAERVASFAEGERQRLSSMPDPFSSLYNLYERALEAVERQLGPTPDATVLRVARQSLLDGAGYAGMIFVVTKYDREWFRTHAAEVVQAAPGSADYVHEALKDL